MAPKENANHSANPASSRDVELNPSPTREPVAIVGMACRFPGAEDLDTFWQLLLNGKNSVTEGVPGSGAGRLADLVDDPRIEHAACRFGAFVEDIDLFDAAFFRISPVEAELLDPQQRMMLETSWLALEDAGIDPIRLSGSRTGVYTGISNDEYRMLVLDSINPSEAAGSLYALSGTNLNGTSGRVSFVLGLMGPAKAVDAACASALVAVHDAVADLQQGKADLALAGGVQAILNSRVYELRAESMMLSPDGQCKTFDASANGYVRGEGCGVVVLKRLSEAEADGDRIWAVIRGAAVNHGGASVGLTVPHTPALEQVIETALSEAGVAASEIDYLEAHGTGTAVGDPIEIEAAASVYGPGREADRPLLIGSVKTNIGHLESAAGIAGLIKAAMAVKCGVIPKHLHFNDPNPRIDWDRLPMRVTTEMTDWPQRGKRPRLAGVNSFGISGTNAHLVVEEYRCPGEEVGPGNGLAGPAQTVPVSLPAFVTEPKPPTEAPDRRQDRFLPLSAKTDGAVRDLAGRYLSWLDERTEELADRGDLTEELLSDMSWTAGVGRSHFDRRAGCVFRDAASLRVQLNELADTYAAPEAGVANKVAFVYTGQGSQWVGMGQALYESEPVARAVLDRCEEVFRHERGASLLDVMFGREGGEGELGDTAWEQPALYALECALTALWSSVGVRPAVVLGHSVGELAAAQAAGVFSLEDGMRFAAARGELLSRTEEGAMAAVFAPPAQVASALESSNAQSDGVGLCISGDNGAHQVVSGPTADIEAIVERFESEGIRARRLNTKRAFHSPLVEPALDRLEAALEDVSIALPGLVMISNLTGRAVEPDMALDASYWKRHAREPVAFASGVRALAKLDVDVLVEIGPHAVLGPMAMLTWPEPDPGRRTPGTPAVLASLRRPPKESQTCEPETGFVHAVAEAYRAGLQVSFEGLFAGESRHRIQLPGYPFQRDRYWVETQRPRRASSDHPLLGVRHESARGDITFETEVFPTDPAWLGDHRVFDRVIAPGALYGAMTASMLLAEGNAAAVEDMQIHSPLVFSDRESEDETVEQARRMQVVLDASGTAPSRGVQVFSRAPEGEWTLHLEGRVAPSAPAPQSAERIDPEDLKARLSPADVPAYYRAKADTGIQLGPSFRTLGMVWSGPGEALGEVCFPDALGRNELDVHPLLLDGCFQVVGVARNMSGGPEEPTYLPFGWERLWLTRRLPDRLLCHVRMSDASGETESERAAPAEILSAELRIYDASGVLLGGLSGYTVKRATRAALLSVVEEVDDLLYEVVWRDKSLESALAPADFFPSPDAAAARAQLFTGYLSDAGVDPQGRNALLADLERWSRSRALATLEELGWRRYAGEAVDPENLRERLGVLPEHSRLFERMLEMLARSGVLEETGDGFVVVLDPEDPLPESMPHDLEEFANHMTELYPDGLTEIGLFRRSGVALADVLRGQADPLTLLFSSGEPTAADLYLKAPVARAANRMLAEAVETLVGALPEGRRLRVIEVGAGTGSATASVLPELPEGRFDYTYTDISAGFFSEAEARFGDGGGCIDYRPLDIERDPIAQGFDSHGYDLLIASNVLHATRYLQETLAHCLALLAPSGQLVALENLRGLGWMDLTFGQLDGWWRFADDYRPHHALATPSVWRQALGDAGFEGIEVLGVDDSYSHEMLDKGVIVAQGPAQVTEPPGVWVLAASGGDAAEELAAELAARNQTVVLAESQGSAAPLGSSVTRSAVDAECRESWRTLIEGLPGDVPFSGIVHLQALEGHGTDASTEEIAQDIRSVVTSALALVQGVTDSGAIPEKGLWFLTSGAQVLEREGSGELAGSTLWGLGKVATLETTELQPRMIDLDPGSARTLTDIANELLYPDDEDHIAYRQGRRRAARLVRTKAAGERATLPQESDWVLVPDRDGVFERPQVKMLAPRSLEPKEVLVAVDAAGLNFWDVFRSLGFIEDGDLGREMCGHVLDVGSDVSTVSAGERVVGLGFGAFAPEMVTREELVAPAPAGASTSDLATIPSAFVSAALSYELSGLNAGERVLIHAGAGGVGLAAIQLAQAAGAEVFATASAPKQAYLRSVGVEHIFDSRQTSFGEEILEVTGGEGVHVVLNSLTSEGFIDASLSCLARGGRFVELARRDILSEEEMAALRPDVAYSILELDVLKKTDPAWVGRVLRGVMQRLAAGELKPLVHSRWPLAEAGAALAFMRSARHLGKIVLTRSPLTDGQLRQDRTYLVTGGLGGIGCAVAEWLADRGAGAIVLNGRRDPDAEAEQTIGALRERGVRIEVELADVTDTDAIDAMLERMDEKLPPLGGVIHSVGVLSDAALVNQTWTSFEQVLWPKVVGAWHLHKATVDRDLDMFVLFSSRVGVMGNPGQANHAAANAFLDQLAGHRRSLGLPGQAIAWGAWSEIGEAAEQRERIESRRAALGGRWFTPQQGIRALERLVRQDATTSVVMSMDWSVFEDAVDHRPALLKDLLTSATDDRTDDSSSSEDLLSRLRGAPAAEHGQVLVSFLQQEVQAVLRLSKAPSQTVGFFDLGMDSLMSVELRNRLNRALSGEYVVSNTAVFDYPNVEALAGHLAGELADVLGAESGKPVSEPVVARPRTTLSAPYAGEDAIAIVGMACRFPGAPDLASFWSLLESGGEAISDGRRGQGPWTGVVGDPEAEDVDFRRGGFLEDIDQFDNRFFRISPIEARMMDPQQRLLLETTWQALEDAGIDPGGLKGSRTGVYAGMGSSEYRDIIAASGQDDLYFGTSGSMTAGRIAFVLGLEGPAMPVDMACASSLATVHHAAGALRRGEIDLALAGGVNTLLSIPLVRFHKEMGLLSSAGRCNAFDENADGFVRSEGCGVLVLKRLSEAEADGDRIWGLVKGTAVNQSGASAGLPVPRGPALERVIEEALAPAGVAPAEVDYLEAHGAGTELGDSIELRAVASVYGREREPERPLLLGSVKTNIGHTEWASGVASIIKAVMAMHRGKIPAHLHLRDPNPNFDWDELPVRITSEMTDWPAVPHRPPLSAVNAFGLSGTNAHVVLEGYERSDDVPGAVEDGSWPAGSPKGVDASSPEAINGSPGPDGVPARRTARLLPLSGKSPKALRDAANRYLWWLDEHPGERGGDNGSGHFLSDMAWTASIGRSHFDCRSGLVFRNVEELRDGLRSLANADAQGDWSEPHSPPRTAFVYSNGAQWEGMAEALYGAEPVIRSVLDQCDELVREQRDASLLEAMLGQKGLDRYLNDPAWFDTAIFALQCALTAQWESVGVRPSAALGHGISGALAAAQAAGVLDLANGLRIASALGDLKDALRQRDATAGLEGLEPTLADVALSPPSVSLVSNLTGRVIESADELDAGYWGRQAQGPEDLAKAGEALARLGVDVLVEIGPDATQGQTIVDAWPESEGAPVLLSATASPSDNGAPAGPDEEFVRTVAGAYEAGLDINFSGLFSGEVRRRISLPSYPFQRRRHWV